MVPRLHARRTAVRRVLAFALVAALGWSRTGRACDICAVYTATEQGESRTGFRAGLATQYTHYGTLLENGHEVPNPDDQYLNSTITQLVLGYQVMPRFGLQVNVPFISRQYVRPQDGKNVRGNVTGFGDLSVIGNVLAHSIVTERSLFRFTLLGGLKLPSGDSSFLAEELPEVLAAGVRRLVPRHVGEHPVGGGHGEADHHAEQSGIHGHDLALGSGSVDGIVGGDLYWSWQRAFVSGGMQYAVRTEGSFQYQFANDLTWAGGPGAYVLLEHDYSLALQGIVSGETKGKDHQAGVRLGDTGVTTVFVGPRLLFTWGTSLAAEATVELPVVRHETSLQIAPDERVRAAAIWRF